MGLYGPLGPGGFRRRGRRRGLIVGAAAGATVAHNMSRKKDDSGTENTTSASTMDADYTAELKRLHSLRAQDLITEQEYQAKKKQVLGI